MPSRLSSNLHRDRKKLLFVSFGVTPDESFYLTCSRHGSRSFLGVVTHLFRCGHFLTGRTDHCCVPASPSKPTCRGSAKTCPLVLVDRAASRSPFAPDVQFRG